MKPYGMQINCVSSGQQAIDAIRDEKVRYNAVFMDHMMPGIDGIEATRRIREIGTVYAMTVPIIALTANAIVGNQEMFLRNGFQAFLSKPIEIAKLNAIITEWIRNRERKPSCIEQCGENEIRFSADTCDENDRKIQKNEIIGLDMEKGIKRFGGDEDLYLEVLRSFVVNTPSLLEAAERVNAGSLADYAIVVHGLKGSSRGICAEIMGDKAEKLEKAAKAEDFASVSANTPRFLEDARKLVSQISDMLSKVYKDYPKPKKDMPDKGTLHRLLNACQNCQINDVDISIAELVRYDYENDGGLAAWLLENAEQMNFDEIIEKLSALLETSPA